MSDRSADGIGSMLPGHYGTEGATGVTLSAATIAAAWNVQGNPAQASFVAGVQQLFDVPLPRVPNTTKRGNSLIAMWLGPQSWLLVDVSPLRLPSTLVDFRTRRDALNALGGALFDVSASRVGYRLRGTHAATVLSKSCPLDFVPDVFRVGGCAQSVFGRVNALIYQQDATPTFLLLVARSLALDVWHLLCRSSAQYGYEVEASHPVGEVR